MKRAILQITVVSLVLLSSIGCRSMTGQSLGTNVDNKTITATVKTRLVADQLQNLTWVDVDTSAGTVYLTGTATTEAQKQRATELARGVKGVQRVVNNIEVRPSAAAASQQPQRSQATSASPAMGAAAGSPMTLTGEVVRVDRTDGQIVLRTGAGEQTLRLSPGAVGHLQPGDRVRVEIVTDPR
jgi:hyperosmotically inducible protein